MGLTIKWDITYKCNLYCSHCLNGQYLNNSISELNTEQIKEIVHKIASKTKIDYIHFLGGEPTVRKDFIEICSFVNKQNIKFGFNSNGLLINDILLSNLIKFDNFTTLVLSLDGPNEKINDEIRGKNVFNKIVNAISKINEWKSKFNKNDLSLQINFVLSKANVMYLKEMLYLMKEYPIQYFTILGLEESGNAKDKGFGLSINETIDTLKITAEFNEIENLKFEILTKFIPPLATDYCKEMFGLNFPQTPVYCGAGSTFAFINNVGEMYPCNRYLNFERYRAENILKDDFLDIWNKKMFDEAYEITEGSSFYSKISPCNKCQYSQKNCYPCYLTVKDEVSICKEMISRCPSIIGEN